MLDTFEIVTTSGVVLWSRSYTPTSPAIINGLIKNVFIEERTRAGGAGASDDISAANNPPYKHDQHTLKWTTVKELNLIFVVSKSWTAIYTCSNHARTRLCTDHSSTFPGSTSLWTISRHCLSNSMVTSLESPIPLVLSAILINTSTSKLENWRPPLRLTTYQYSQPHLDSTRKWPQETMNHPPFLDFYHEVCRHLYLNYNSRPS